MKNTLISALFYVILIIFTQMVIEVKSTNSSSFLQQDSPATTVTTETPKVVEPNVVVAPKDTCKEEFEAIILHAHNEYRKKHGVEALIYDDIISSRAQIYADYLATQNKMIHSTESVQDIGENIYLNGSITKTAYNAEGCRSLGKKAVDNWYSEIKFYDYSNPVFNRKTGHFTQVIWKDTNLIGCGIHISEDHFHHYYLSFVVCQYLNPGNYEGEFSKEPVAESIQLIV